MVEAVTERAEAVGSAANAHLIRVHVERPAAIVTTDASVRSAIGSTQRMRTSQTGGGGPFCNAARSATLRKCGSKRTQTKAWSSR